MNQDCRPIYKDRVERDSTTTFDSQDRPAPARAQASSASWEPLHTGTTTNSGGNHYIQDSEARSHSGNASPQGGIYNHSVFAVIANHEYFQNTTLSVIVFNALWISVDTEWNHTNLRKSDGSLPLEPASTIIENFFCVYFTVEVILRFLAYKRKSYCRKDAWFVFDSLLVFFMILETWVFVIVEAISGNGGSDALSNLSALRLLRLLRLTRMMRLMRQVPELMMLCKGMFSATKVVFWILMFLILMTYVFGIIFTSQFGEPLVEQEEGSAKDIFGSIGDSMMSLFTHGVLGDDLNACTSAIIAESTIMFWVFMVFFFVSAMTLLNMLIGVLCEIIGSSAEEDKVAFRAFGIRVVLEECFNGLDTNHDGQVSELEWTHLKENEPVKKSFVQAGWDSQRIDEQLDQVQRIIFSKRDGRKGTVSLDMCQLCEKVAEISPTKSACIIDLTRTKTRNIMNTEKASAQFQELEKEFVKALTQKNIPIPERTAQKDTRRLHGGGPDLSSVSTKELLAALKKRAPGHAPLPELRQLFLGKQPEIWLTSSFQSLGESAAPRTLNGEATDEAEETNQTSSSSRPSSKPKRSTISQRIREQLENPGSEPISLNAGSGGKHRKSNKIQRGNSRASTPCSRAATPSFCEDTEPWSSSRAATPGSTVVAFDMPKRVSINAAGLEEDQGMARGHILFQQLVLQHPPGGWMAARCIAAQLEACPLMLPELSKRTHIGASSEVQALLLALPQLFEMKGEPLVAHLRKLDTHVHGCRYEEPESDDEFEDRLRGCHCVWRLCDALHQADGSASGAAQWGVWGAKAPKLPPRSRTPEHGARGHANVVTARAARHTLVPLSQGQARSRPLHDLESTSE